MAKISFFAFLFCFYFAYATEPEAFRSKIVGGTETAPNEFPWIVHLTAREPDGLPTNYAGSLITDRCILTGGFVLNRYVRFTANACLKIQANLILGP